MRNLIYISNRSSLVLLLASLIFIAILFLNAVKSYGGEFDDIVLLNSIPVKSEVAALKEKIFSRKGALIRYNHYEFDSKGRVKIIRTYDSSEILLEITEFRVVDETTLNGIKIDNKKKIMENTLVKLDKKNKIIERIIYDGDKSVKSKFRYKYDEIGGLLNETIYLNNALEVVKKFMLKIDHKTGKYVEGCFLNSLFEIRQEWKFINKQDMSDLTIKNVNDGAGANYTIKYNPDGEIAGIGYLDVDGVWKGFMIYEYIINEKKKTIRITEYEKNKKKERKDIKSEDNPAEASIELTNEHTFAGGGLNYSNAKNEVLNIKSKLKKKNMSLLDEVCAIQEALIRSGYNNEGIMNAYSFFKAVADTEKISAKDLEIRKKYNMNYNNNRAVYNLEKSASTAEMNKFIKDNRININKCDAGTGKTILMQAVIRKNEKLVRFLVDCKADASLKDNNGKNVVDYVNESDADNIKKIIFSYIQ